MSGMPFLNNSIFTGPVIGFNSNPESPMIPVSPVYYRQNPFFSISSPGPIFTIEELWSIETFRGHSIGHMKSALQYGINILIRLKKFSVNTNHV